LNIQGLLLFLPVLLFSVIAHEYAHGYAALKQGDTTALSLCMDNHVPIHVFELAQGNIRRVAAGERVGTIIRTL
jgi:uridylate kinase